jgi:putative addiction module antidote
MSRFYSYGYFKLIAFGVPAIVILMPMESPPMTSLKLTTIGASIGVIIPEEMLTRMGVAKGDTLYAVEAPDGSYRLTPYDPAFAKKMEKAEEIMRRYRNTLHILAQ